MQLDRIFKALANPTRRSIIDRLRARPDQSLFQICSEAFAEGGMALSRQAITQHLDMLERAGLIDVAWSGRTKIHTLKLGPLQDAADFWLSNYVREGNVE